MAEVFLEDKEIRVILSLLANLNNPPKGLDPTFYHSLSYEGDLKLEEIANGIRDKLT